MKKQGLVLIMCITLSASATLAQGANTEFSKTNIQANNPTTESKTVPASKILNKTGFPTAQMFANPETQPQIITREEARQHFETRKAHERGLMYAALKFSDEQKAQAEALDSKTRAEAGKLLRKVQIESKKLKDLQTKHASIFAIYKQKFELRSARIKADKYLAGSRKSFDAILTKEQRTKFEEIQEARREEMEKFRQEHQQQIQKNTAPDVQKKETSPEHSSPAVEK